jgi:large subunit ribosomal protein L32
MPVPKQRRGKADKRARRANWKAIPTASTFCVNCGSPKLTHAVCTVCGYYNGKIVSPRFAKRSGFDKVAAQMNGMAGAEMVEESSVAVAEKEDDSAE